MIDIGADKIIGFGIGCLVAGPTGAVIMAIIAGGTRSESPCARCEIMADPEADRAYCLDCPAVKKTAMGA